ncbi:lysoplasmalogenase family protein [Variovorax sp. PCZ-1]|uniref:lysoplasmalogenase family protein n=1 Tax=Variovorax sp. PCZ-1 TaxID=2835533 RepID=UPI001BCC8DF0|nr:lysoplasmalogenase family protein [Variovorax sp. PCZ-1]MBS7808136.1 sterol desaturase family protein [Variovorax sp. PCZ-1]
MSKVIVLATPVFFLLIAIEYFWGIAKGRNTYRLQDAISSIGLGMMSQFTAVFTRLLRVGVYTAVYASLSLVPLDAAKEFWNTWYGWVLALIFYDFCYYWLHRMGHESAILWAAHVVHHQSQDYNLSTALRQTSSGALLGWIFYIPMALAGVPPAVFGIVALIDLLYQFWVHTEHVPKLGWFDRWFCSPSNHRVHHAVNDRYVDRNYGGILVVWDRMFGSFKEEDEKCVYGTRSPLKSWDPLWANAEVYTGLLKDAWHTRSWADKVRVFLKPPGWRPADVAARFPKPAFDIESVRSKYYEPTSRAANWFGAVSFNLLLGGVAAFLWVADGMGQGLQLVSVATLCAMLWLTNAVLQARLHPWLGVAGWAAAIATASACFAQASGGSAADAWLVTHRIFKPLGVGFALIYIALCTDFMPAIGQKRSKNLLIAALAFSIAGDAWLMFPGFFIQGLASFLIAHLFYIALFKQGVSWFPSKPVLAACLAYGVAMYAYLLPNLSTGLQIPVAVYVFIIALMGAQAVGRAIELKTTSSKWVAVGSLLFMASDSLLAINKFVSPIPLSPLWILGTYFAAQIIIARHALGSRAD